MPIVNRANYTECASCHRWMFYPNQALQGNRAFICIDCYGHASKQGSRETQDTFSVAAAAMNAKAAPTSSDSVSEAFVNAIEAEDYVKPADPITRANFEPPRITEARTYASAFQNLLLDRPTMTDGVHRILERFMRDRGMM